MQEFMQAQGTNVSIINPPYEDMRLFDGGLRAQLYVDYDFAALASRLSQTKEHTIYTLTDGFETHYISFKHPNQDTTLVIIGPYMTQDYRNIVVPVSEQMKLPQIQAKELKEYYVGVPRYEDNDTPVTKVMVMAKYLFGKEEVATIDASTILQHNPEAYEIRLEPERLLSYALIEERYSIEDAMLDAVERGDYQEALKNRNMLSKYSIEARNPEHLRNQKTLCISFNTMLRRAALKGSVHPAYIDSVSVSFAKAIEAAVSINALKMATEDMVKKYCRLVQEHSLRKHSKIVQRVLNYIDFNYAEALSLNLLANIAGTHANYLSTQFKKEMGLPITDYINRIRIRRSLPLLATTNLPISTISEKVGLADYNYYTRLFKKVMEKSPSDYRRSLRG